MLFVLLLSDSNMNIDGNTIQIFFLIFGIVRNVSISLVAKNEEGTIVGVLFGLTDFAYWLYVTDLGVDRMYEGQGIGRKLMKMAHELSGGEKDHPHEFIQ